MIRALFWKDSRRLVDMIAATMALAAFPYISVGLSALHVWRNLVYSMLASCSGLALVAALLGAHSVVEGKNNATGPFLASLPCSPAVVILSQIAVGLATIGTALTANAVVAWVASAQIAEHFFPRFLSATHVMQATAGFLSLVLLVYAFSALLGVLLQSHALAGVGALTLTFGCSLLLMVGDLVGRALEKDPVGLLQGLFKSMLGMGRISFITSFLVLGLAVFFGKRKIAKG